MLMFNGSFLFYGYMGIIVILCLLAIICMIRGIVAFIQDISVWFRNRKN